MTRRSGLWRALAWLFTLVNLGGAGFAAARGEGLHTAVHVGLLLLGAAWVWWLGLRAGRQDQLRMQPAEQRLAQLQESVDAIALELERISEAQRFVAKLLVDRGEATHPASRPERVITPH